MSGRMAELFASCMDFVIFVISVRRMWGQASRIDLRCLENEKYVTYRRHLLTRLFLSPMVDA